MASTSIQLQKFIRKDQCPPELPEPWTTMSGRDAGGLSQAPSTTTQINHRTQRSVAGDLGQPAARTDQQGC